MLLQTSKDRSVRSPGVVAALAVALTLGCTPSAGEGGDASAGEASPTSSAPTAPTATDGASTGDVTTGSSSTGGDAASGTGSTTSASSFDTDATSGTEATQGTGATEGTEGTEGTGGADQALREELEAIVDKTGVPALGVARLDGPELSVLAVVGARKLGDPTPALDGDAFHLGSCTKTMTATMLALLVEEGSLSWDDTLEASFPELSEVMHPSYADVTLEEILAHRGGLPASLFDFPELHEALWEPGDPVVQRRALTASLLALPPETPPNTLAVYSNAGYMVVASAIEERLGIAWEELLVELLVEPLAMDSCGLGTPASEGMVDAPWGHVPYDGELVAVPPGPGADNPPPYGPAARVHCNLEDWSRFVDVHRAGAAGSGEFLGEDSWERLHTDHGEGFGLGMLVAEDPQLGQILVMDGSNTTFYATFVVIPGDDRGLLAVANAGPPAGQMATGEALSKIF